MNVWKPCAECGDPTMLTLYCEDCFKKNFKKVKVSPLRQGYRVPDMTRLKDLEKIISDHMNKAKK